MKPKVSLRIKVLLLAVINAVFLIALLVVFAKTQLTQDIRSLLLGESRARITAVAMELARQLPALPSTEQNALLERLSSKHGVHFYLFHIIGMQVAGPPITLPEELKQYLTVQREKSPLAVLEGISRRTDAPPPPVLGQQSLDAVSSVVQEAPVFVTDSRGYWVVLRMPLRASDRQGFQPGTLVMMSESLIGTPFFFNLTPWLGLSAALVLLALGCWLPLVRGATKDIAMLSSATSEIAKGKFTEKVDIQRSDELGQLGHSFNRMASQLEGYVHGQKRFLRDAAHELRSPLARMQAALGNALESNPGDAQPFLEDLREEIDLMSSLTGELLTFAREENQQGRLKLSPVNLSEMAARVIATENPTGLADVRADIDKEWNVAAHPESLFRGLSNVVRNAIRYAGEPITVSAERVDGKTIVTVKDNGPGIPEESLELIFTPFYRLDVSRNRNTGGNGLGMAIARTCIESCKGTIYCRNGKPGLEVIITLRIRVPDDR